MSWAYNQIDIYFLLKELPLGVTSVDLTDDEMEWFAASTYGIVRNRPTLTPSQMQNATGTTIPGRNGVIYPSYASRGNAKLQFDILVENSWVHNVDDDGTVQERADLLMALIRDAKVISYKMPGCPANFYLYPKKADCTIANADENAIVLQATVEIEPFKYWFTGNRAHTLTQAQDWSHFNYYPNGVCKPILVIKSTNSGNIVFQMGNEDSHTIVCTEMEMNTVLDSNKCLAYVDNEEGRVNMNSHFTGDYTQLWFPVNDTAHFVTSLNGSIDIYTKEGVVL